MEENNKKTDESVKAGLTVETNHTADQAEPATTGNEQDADEMVHEQSIDIPGDNPAIDPDEAVHQQADQPIPDPTTETDIDDLMHSPDAGDEIER